MFKIAWLLFFAQLAFAAYPECLKDGDCIIRPVNCCKCTQGGKLKAVLKNTPEPDCSDRVCAQVISKDKSCQAKRAVCRHNKCELGF